MQRKICSIKEPVRKLLLASLLLSGLMCVAQTDTATFTAELFRYEVHPNIVYHTANNYEAKLDVYQPADKTQPTPVVIVIHGGGWIAGTKEERVLEIMPYLQMGIRRRECRIPYGACVSGSGGGGRLPLRAALGVCQREEIQL